MGEENIERNLKHLFDGTEWNVYDMNVLNLGVGAPGTDLLENCCEIFQTATQHRMKYEFESNSSLLFQYGPPNGILEARQAISTYLSEKYQDPVKSEDIIVTSGATQGLHLIVSTLVDLDGYIFVDEVTYMIALDTIKHFTGLHIIPVRLNDNGVDLQQLEALFIEHKMESKSKEFWGMYYTIPNFHNPTGMVFSEETRSGLIKLARKYDILITCDDVYNILNYKDTKPPKRLFAYDDHTQEDFKGHVISNGSFSKIIGPGLRYGWLEAPARVQQILVRSGIINSGGCLNNYTSGIVASLFDLGLAQQHIEKLYAAYKERMLGTIEVLANCLPKSCSFVEPSGGYFIWITIPKSKDATKFLDYCMERHKIFFIVGTRFTPYGGAENSFRISIGFHSKEKLVDGANRLCAALHEFLQLES